MDDAWQARLIICSHLLIGDSLSGRLAQWLSVDPTDNMALGSAKPSAKVTHYAQNPVYLTKSLTDMTTLIPKEKLKIEQHFKDAGVKEIKWDLQNWNQNSIDERFDLYFALLKNDLTTY